MLIINNSEELKKLVNKYNDLIYPNEDVRIKFEPTKDEIRNVECQGLFMMNYNEKFNFNGGYFNGWDFNGGDFNGWDFNGWDFNGRNFNGRNFNGRNFNGKKISYYAFFNCSGSIKCESIEGRRDPHAKPVCLDGKIEFIKTEGEEVLKAIKLLEEKGKLKDGKILI